LSICANTGTHVRFPLDEIEDHIAVLSGSSVQLGDDALQSLSFGSRIGR